MNFSRSAVELGPFWEEYDAPWVSKKALSVPPYGIQLYFSEGFNNISVDSNFLQI